MACNIFLSERTKIAILAIAPHVVGNQFDVCQIATLIDLCQIATLIDLCQIATLINLCQIATLIDLCQIATVVAFFGARESPIARYTVDADVASALAAGTLGPQVAGMAVPELKYVCSTLPVWAYFLSCFANNTILASCGGAFLIFSPMAARDPPSPTELHCAVFYSECVSFLTVSSVPCPFSPLSLRYAPLPLQHRTEPHSTFFLFFLFFCFLFLVFGAEPFHGIDRSKHGVGMPNRKLSQCASLFVVI
jgi:hypothetical protein